MTVRRATPKEQQKRGVQWISRRAKPVVRSTPPPAPWSIEAIAAYDRAELARNLPPMMAFNLRRIESGGALCGVFDLRVTHWHLTLRNCRWFVKGTSREWVGLPNQVWVDRHGTKHYEEIIVFDDVHLPRFQESALIALHRLLALGEAVDPKSAEHNQVQHHQPRMNGNGAVHVEVEADDVPF